MARASHLGLGLCLALAACGGPPKVDAPPGADVGAPDAAALTTERPDAGAPAESTPEDAGAAPSPGATAPDEPTPLDECTTVSAALEKRVRPKLQACYREGKKKNPNLEGKVRISIDVDTLGKIHAVKLVEQTLPKPVSSCMLKAVKAEPFPAADKCPGKAVIIPIQFPTKSRSDS